jgi:hypothetical protein
LSFDSCFVKILTFRREYIDDDVIGFKRSSTGKCEELLILDCLLDFSVGICVASSKLDEFHFMG